MTTVGEAVDVGATGTVGIAVDGKDEGVAFEGVSVGRTVSSTEVGNGEMARLPVGSGVGAKKGISVGSTVDSTAFVGKLVGGWVCPTDGVSIGLAVSEGAKVGWTKGVGSAVLGAEEGDTVGV